MLHWNAGIGWKIGNIYDFVLYNSNCRYYYYDEYSLFWFSLDYSKAIREIIKVIENDFLLHTGLIYKNLQLF